MKSDTHTVHRHSLLELVFQLPFSYYNLNLLQSNLLTEFLRKKKIIILKSIL